MLPRTLLICVLDLIAVRETWGWNHVSRSEFETLTTVDELSLIAFVHPNTDASKSLEAEWLSATSTTNHKLFSIDCALEQDLCAEYDVSSYPAIRLLQGSRSIKRYKGPRNASELTSYLDRASFPPLSILTSENITSFPLTSSSSGISFILYTTTSPSNHHLQSIFHSLALTHSDTYSFYLTTDLTLFPPTTPIPSIICPRTTLGTEAILPIDPGTGLPAMENFVKTSTEPIIGDFTRRTEAGYMKAGKSIVYYFASSDDQREHFKVTLREVALKYKEYLSFVTVDVGEYGGMLKALGHERGEKGEEGVVSVFNPMYGLVYPMGGGGIDARSVEDFVVGIAEGRVREWVPGRDEGEVKGDGDGEGEKKVEGKVKKEKVGIVHDEM